MAWGLIARAEPDRGLGVLTRLMYQNLQPDKTLLITVDGPYRQETEVFPDALVMHWDGGDLDEATVKGWLDGLDVVVSAEIFYDWRIVTWARELGVRTVLYVMPELFKRELLSGELPMPDQFWYPSSWMPSPSLPAGDILPLPCEERPFVDFPTATTLQFVHVAGKPALADRNGTHLLALASKRTQGHNSLTVYSQDAIPRFHSNVNVWQGPENKWEMYESAHTLIMPRRFGGLCLPVVEALACGLAVIMPDISPNKDWPIKSLRAQPGAVVEMPIGPVQTYDTDLQDIASALRVADNSPSYFMERSRQWTQANTWAKRKHAFLDALS